MKKIEENECFGISSNLFPCVDVGMYDSILTPSEYEISMEVDTPFEYCSVDAKEWTDDVTLYAASFIEDEVCPIMKKYGVENIMVEEIHSPQFYNYETDCLYFTVEMSATWRDVMRKWMTEFRKDEKFQRYIEEHYYSRSGFCSFMPQSLEEIEGMEDEERCISAYLTLCLLNEGEISVDKNRIAERSRWSIYEDVTSNTSSVHYANVPEEYLGKDAGEELERLYKDDSRMNELYHSLSERIGFPWKNTDKLHGKMDEFCEVYAENDAMRLILWACENGHTLQDLERMAA